MKRRTKLCIYFSLNLLYLCIFTVTLTLMAGKDAKTVDQMSNIVFKTEEVKIADMKVDMEMKVDVDELEDAVDRLTYPKGKQLKLLETKPVMHNPRLCFDMNFYSPLDYESATMDINSTRHSFVPRSGWVPVNEDMTSNMPERIDWIFYVHSSVDNFEKRRTIRKTWGNPKLFKNYNMRIIFVFGIPSSPYLQQNAKMEFSVYGDILQGDFLDTYKNLTFKAVFALRWLSTYCSHVPIVMKTDDDTFVNIFEMKKYLVRYSDLSRHFEDDIQNQYWNGYNKSNLIQKRINPETLKSKVRTNKTIICPLYAENNMPILRDKKTCMKWCLSKKDLPGRIAYPRYCAGMIYFITMPLVRELCNRVQFTPFLWIDDVYITGLLTTTIPNINYVTILPSCMLNATVAIDQYKNISEPLLIHIVQSGGPAKFAQLWNLLLNRLTNEDAEELTLPVKKLKLWLSNI